MNVDRCWPARKVYSEIAESSWVWKHGPLNLVVNHHFPIHIAFFGYDYIQFSDTPISQIVHSIVVYSILQVYPHYIHLELYGFQPHVCWLNYRLWLINQHLYLYPFMHVWLLQAICLGCVSCRQLKRGNGRFPIYRWFSQLETSILLGNFPTRVDFLQSAYPSSQYLPKWWLMVT